jgi:DnaJ-like protein
MPTLIFGVVALVLILWLLKVFTKADVQKLASKLRPSVSMKVVGGIAALVLGTVLQVRGQVIPGTILYFIGVGMLGWLPWGTGFGQRTQKSTGQISRVRSAFVEMELDHDSGTMRGRILVGRYEGVALDTLDIATLVGLLAEIDEESRALLATYLDRRQPGWREHAQNDATAGQGSAPRSGPMTAQEAYQILGLEPGASAEDISRAHRTLMKKLHPDQGGTNYLAARVNEAKEVLLERHR